MYTTIFIVYLGSKVSLSFDINHMQEVDVMNLFTYQANYQLKGNALEKMVYFDFYNAEWVGYLCTNTGKKICTITSASKIHVEKELEDFETIDQVS